jgi:hypothetical protein
MLPFAVSYKELEEDNTGSPRIVVGTGLQSRIHSGNIFIVKSNSAIF